MYLHLGGDTVIPSESVIGIFDMDNVTVSRVSRDFLETAQSAGTIVNIFEDIPKSFIVESDKNKKTKVYLSQISPATLRKRWERDGI